MPVGESICYALSFLLFLIFFPFSLFCTLRIVKEYEKAVILRMGKVKGGPKGPGVIFYLPCNDSCYIIDLRLEALDVPTQETLTKDAVPVSVNAVVFYKILNPVYCVLNVADFRHATITLAMTMLRSIIGQKSLTEVLEQREKLSKELHKAIDIACERWGIFVEHVELKEVSLPEAMQRAMATEAEARQEARAKIIDADAELKASTTLRTAADMISKAPGALQLRYLQTLGTITVERPSTILFPIPMDLRSAKL